MPPDRAAKRGLTCTVTFPTGNLAPEGAVVKSTAIDPSVIDADGVFRKTGTAKVFTREPDAMRAIKDGGVVAGDILVLMCAGPKGSGMEEIFQITSALRHLSFGRQIAVVTDARFSGVSAGACIGHVGPEALAGGPIGKVQTGDFIRIEIDTRRLMGRLDLVGDADCCCRSARSGARESDTGFPAAPKRPEPTARSARMIPGYGPRCRKWAAAPGAVACLMSTALSRCLRPAWKSSGKDTNDHKDLKDTKDTKDITSFRPCVLVVLVVLVVLESFTGRRRYEDLSHRPGRCR